MFLSTLPSSGNNYKSARAHKPKPASGYEPSKRILKTLPSESHGEKEYMTLHTSPTVISVNIFAKTKEERLQAASNLHSKNTNSKPLVHSQSQRSSYNQATSQKKFLPTSPSSPHINKEILEKITKVSPKIAFGGERPKSRGNFFETHDTTQNRSSATLKTNRTSYNHSSTRSLHVPFDKSGTGNSTQDKSYKEQAKRLTDELLTLDQKLRTYGKASCFTSPSERVISEQSSQAKSNSSNILVTSSSATRFNTDMSSPKPSSKLNSSKKETPKLKERPNHQTERASQHTERPPKRETSKERTKTPIHLSNKSLENIKKTPKRKCVTPEKNEKKHSLSAVRSHIKMDESKGLINSNLFKTVGQVVKEKREQMTTRQQQQPPASEPRQARSQSRERSKRALSASKEPKDKSRASSLSAFKQNRPSSNFDELSFKRKTSPFVQNASLSSSSSIKTKQIRSMPLSQSSLAQGDQDNVKVLHNNFFSAKEGIKSESLRRDSSYNNGHLNTESTRLNCSRSSSYEQIDGFSAQPALQRVLKPNNDNPYFLEPLTGSTITKGLTIYSDKGPNSHILPIEEMVSCESSTKSLILSISARYEGQGSRNEVEKRLDQNTASESKLKDHTYTVFDGHEENLAENQIDSDAKDSYNLRRLPENLEESGLPINYHMELFKKKGNFLSKDFGHNRQYKESQEDSYKSNSPETLNYNDKTSHFGFIDENIAEKCIKESPIDGFADHNIDIDISSQDDKNTRLNQIVETKSRGSLALKWETDRDEAFKACTSDLDFSHEQSENENKDNLVNSTKSKRNNKRAVESYFEQAQPKDSELTLKTSSKPQENLGEAAYVSSTKVEMSSKDRNSDRQSSSELSLDNKQLIESFRLQIIELDDDRRENINNERLYNTKEKGSEEVIESGLETLDYDYENATTFDSTNLKKEKLNNVDDVEEVAYRQPQTHEDEDPSSNDIVEGWQHDKKALDKDLNLTLGKLVKIAEAKIIKKIQEENLNPDVAMAMCLRDLQSQLVNQIDFSFIEDRQDIGYRIQEAHSSVTSKENPNLLTFGELENSQVKADATGKDQEDVLLINEMSVEDFKPSKNMYSVLGDIIKNPNTQNNKMNFTMSFGQEDSLQDGNSKEEASVDSKQKSISGQNESNTHFVCSMNLDEEEEEEESHDFLSYYLKMSSNIEKLQEEQDYSQAILSMKELLTEVNKQELQTQVEANPHGKSCSQDDYKSHIDFRELKIRIGSKLGAQLYAKGQYLEAVEELDRVLSVDPNNLQALYKIHEAHTKLNNRKEARLTLKRIKESMHTPPVMPATQAKNENSGQSLMVSKQKSSITTILEVDESVDASDTKDNYSNGDL